jgi:exosortase/archaeosortase family protein
MHFFAEPILGLDAFFVSLILGTERTGNMVGFADGSGYLVILPACSSITPVSLAMLSWFMMSLATAHRRSTRDMLWCGLASASVILINTARLTISGLSGQYYEALHSKMGLTGVNVLMLTVAVGFCAVGVRRELLCRF